MSAFLIVEEDGYVKVRHPNGRTVCAGVVDGEHVHDIDFPDPADRINNRTRQAAMRALQEAGYR
jgi:hypothetical protein